MSPDSIQSRRLEFQYRKDGIPTASPPAPKHWFPRVPSILCMQHRNPILGYSKAPWGLSVLSRVTGIFTGTTISPGGLLRQCPNHYAFHAGQNLPDKEFRYLRTVIVTAAVHWGFDSMLAHLLLTFQHRAGVSSYTSSFDLAQTCVFGKQLLGPILCGSISGAPLLPKLRGQFAEFLNNPSPVGLESSSYLPVSVCGTGTSETTQLFSPSSISDFGTNFPRSLPEPTPGSETSNVSLCLTLLVVTESLPSVHRLRLSASP